jgi:hypothetical protein
MWLTCELLPTGIHKHKWLFWLRFSTVLWGCRVKSSPRKFLGGGSGKRVQTKVNKPYFFQNRGLKLFNMFKKQIICPDFCFLCENPFIFQYEWITLTQVRNFCHSICSTKWMRGTRIRGGGEGYKGQSKKECSIPLPCARKRRVRTV